MPPNGLGGDGDRASPGPGAVKSARIKNVFDYWISLRGDRLFPAWTDVKLMDVYNVASFVAVLDVEANSGAGGHRFRYRFCGTALVEARSSLTPSDPTGWCIDEILWPFEPSPLLAACAEVVARRKPVMLAAGEVEESHYRLHERGFFPLGPDDDLVTQVIACIDEVPRA